MTVFAKPENSGVKLLDNSPITESHSSVSSLFIYCTQSCLSYKWQVIHRTRALSWTTLVTSRYDIAIPVFFNSAQLLSDDLQKAVMNTDEYNMAICI